MEERGNFPLAVVAGLMAAFIGALLWTMVTVITRKKLGLIAIAIGLLVGTAVRTAGRGTSNTFGLLGAFCGLLGCVAGDLLSDVAFYAQLRHLDVGYVLTHMDMGFLTHLAQAFFKPMDAVFYAIAVFEGYKYSVRRR